MTCALYKGYLGIQIIYKWMKPSQDLRFASRVFGYKTNAQSKSKLLSVTFSHTKWQKTDFVL